MIQKLVISITLAGFFIAAIALLFSHPSFATKIVNGSYFIFLLTVIYGLVKAN